jgi:hypothetical protein
VVSSEPAGHAATSDVASTSKASASAKAAAEVAATHSSSEVAAATTEVTAATTASVTTTTTTTTAACQRISRNGAASQGQSNEQNRDSLQPGFLHGIRLSVGDDSSPSICSVSDRAIDRRCQPHLFVVAEGVCSILRHTSSL